jgi:Tfp pilus assembly protein PilN
VRAVNLIPAEQRRGAGSAASRSGGAAYGVLALLAGLAVLAYLYGSARHQVSSRTAQVASLTSQAQRTAAEAAQLAPYTSFVALNEQRQQVVSELAQSRFDWARATRELGRVLPVNASITSLSGTIGSPGAPKGASTAAAVTSAAGNSTVTSATPPGSVPAMTLGACSTSQSGVARTLNRLRLIDGVGTVTLESSAQGGSGAAGGGGGGCPSRDASFVVELTFEPLPAVSSTSSSPATATTSNGGAR